ncbi:DNA pilot protein [Microvirus sp.]|nr:DNA pilot protein [Microvirus sp.]
MLYIRFRDVGNTELLPHHLKRIRPEIASAGIGAFGNILGGLFGSSSAKAAAKAQLQAVRETNEANARLAQKQNEWNLEQWNRENAYNTPEAQRARYESAGINPYFALGNIQSGNADSLMSADLANQQPVVSPLQGQSGQILGNSISNAAQSGVNSYFNAQIQQEQAKQLQIQNTFDLQSLKDRVNSLHYDSEAKRMANYVYNANMESLISITKNQARMSYTQDAIMNLQHVGTEYDLIAKKFTNDNILPAQASLAKMSLDQMVAQIALTEQQEKLTKKQVDYYADQMAIQWLLANSAWLNAKTGMFNAQTNRLDVKNQIWNRNQSTYRENYVFNRTKNQLVKQIKLGVDMLGRENRFGKTREHMWLDSGHFNRFMWTSGEVFNQVNPFKFYKGR